MDKTIVGVFDDRTEAEQVRNQLVNLGLSTDDIVVQGSGAAGSTGTTSGQAHSSHEGGIKGFFRSLFGMDDDDATGHYAEAVRRGSHVVCATARTDAQAERVATAMRTAGAVDVDSRAARWREQGWTGYRDDAPALSAGELAQERELNMAQRTRIPVVEEAVQVGKRTVERGGVRVFTRVVEQPVEEQITLREEHATIERHAVDRPVTDADLDALRDGTIEVRETVEEPVVQKVARVREEIEVGKRVDERTETIRDTVRHTEVDVDENVAAGRRKDGDRPRPSTR
jgi:stress response protein YsnF